MSGSRRAANVDLALTRLTLDFEIAAAGSPHSSYVDVDLLALDEALARLARLDSQQ